MALEVHTYIGWSSLGQLHLLYDINGNGLTQRGADLDPRFIKAVTGLMLSVLQYNIGHIAPQVMTVEEEENLN